METVSSDGAWSGSGLESLSPMVGRAAELEVLQSRISRLLDGEGGIVTLVGKAGMGKSRLVREALTDPRMAEVRLLVARSLSVAGSLSYHPFSDILRSWAGIADGADDADALACLEEAIESLCGSEAEELVPFVASMMGLSAGGAYAERLAGIEGEALERLIFRSMRLLLQRMAAQRPLLLFFEDLHWADHSSVRMLEVLLRLVNEQPILFVNAFRPEQVETGQRILEVARTQYPLQHRLIRLHPLDKDRTVELAGNLLGSASDDLHASFIAECSEGNPFFVEEVLRSLVDQGVVVVRDGRAHVAGDIDQVALPTTVGELIAARTRHLDPAANRILEAGAVIGRGFLGRILEEVVTGTDLAEVLSSLEGRGILIRRKTRRTAAHARVTFASEVELVFRHALVQETIYDSIEPEKRRALHARVAAAIETVFATRIADFHGMLAYHYSRAEDLAKAEEYLFKAGEEAARAAASSEALSFFRDASQVYLRLHGSGGDPAKKALLERNIGLALMNTGRLTEAMEHFDQSLAYLGDPPPRSKLVAGLRCARELASIFARGYLPASWFGGRRDDRYRDHILALYPRIKAQSTSDPTRLVFDYTRAVYLLNQTDPAAVPDQVIGLYSGFAAMFAYSGISFRIGRRYLEISNSMRRPDHGKDLFDHNCLVCICNFLEGVWDDEQGTVADDVVRAALRYGGLWEVNTYLGLDCDRRLRRGSFAAARERLDELADIAETYGFEFARTNHMAETMLLLLEERRLEEALDAANLYLSSVDDPPLRVLALGSKAKAQTLLGDLEGASATLADAEGVIDVAPVVPPWHLSAYQVARLWRDLEELGGSPQDAALAKRARDGARSALRVARGVAVQRGEIFRLRARLAHLRGDGDGAVRWARDTIAECEKLGALPELARMHADLADWGLDLGDGRDGAAHRARADELFALLGLETAERIARRAA